MSVHDEGYHRNTSYALNENIFIFIRLFFEKVMYVRDYLSYWP